MVKGKRPRTDGRLKGEKLDWGRQRIDSGKGKLEDDFLHVFMGLRLDRTTVLLVFLVPMILMHFGSEAWW